MNDDMEVLRKPRPRPRRFVSEGTRRRRVRKALRACGAAGAHFRQITRASVALAESMRRMFVLSDAQVAELAAGRPVTTTTRVPIVMDASGIVCSEGCNG